MGRGRKRNFHGPFRRGHAWEAGIVPYIFHRIVDRKRRLFFTGNLAGRPRLQFFVFQDRAVEISMTWFGIKISKEQLTYTSPPVADIVTTKRTTHQLVLRFNDGRVKTLGLSTDQEGHQETADMINRFLQTGSVIQ